MLKFLRCTI